MFPTKPRSEEHALTQFGAELVGGYLNRNRNNSRVRFAVDANVMWFYSNCSPTENVTASGYAARFLGHEQVAGLIRRAIAAVAKGAESLHITNSHRHEAEIAYMSDFDVDYERMSADINVVLQRAKCTMQCVANNNRIVAESVVDILKDEFKDTYDLLLDVMDKGRTKTEALLSTLKLVPSAEKKPIPNSLQRTLSNIAFILRAGEDRDSFSVSQDIRALRDIALHNAVRNSTQIILLTFGQKLMSIIRLMQYFGEPWTHYLNVESCQTFWIWNLHENFRSDDREDRTAETLRTLINDLVMKTRVHLTPPTSKHSTESDFAAREFAFDIQETKNELSLSQLLGKTDKEDLERLGEHNKLDLISKIETFLADDESKRKKGNGGVDIVSTAFNDFFKELSRLFPTLAINRFHRTQDDDLVNLILKAELQEDDFLNALEEDIQEHAQRSFAILGASSLLAPKTIRAITTFRNRTSGTSGPTKFVHRLPLPIQGREEVFDDIVSLVIKRRSSIENRYKQLLKTSKWHGAAADLVVAYFYASCGYVSDARLIAKQSIEHKRTSKEIDSSFASYVFCSLQFLESTKHRSRIWTKRKKLLNEIVTLETCAATSDPSQLRVESEVLAGRVNRILLVYYGSLHKSQKVGLGDDHQLSQLITELAEHKARVATTNGLPETLAAKLQANANVNAVLLHDILADGEVDNFAVPISEYGTILRELLERSRTAERISYFEEIISSFALLRHAAILSLDESQEIELVGSLRNKLGWILQRRENLNEFEYSLCERVHRKLNDLGFR